MKLSMWMIYNRLAGLDLTVRISENAPVCLRSARMAYAPDCVFVSEKNGDALCRYGDDFIILHNMEAGQAYELLQDTFDYYQSWDHILQEATNQLDYQKVIKQTWFVFHNPVMLLDQDTRLLAYSEQYQHTYVNPEWDYMMKHGYCSMESLKFLRSHREKFGCYRDTEPTYYAMHNTSSPEHPNMLSCRLLNQGNMLGRVSVIEYERSFNPGDYQLLSHMSKSLQYILANTSGIPAQKERAKQLEELLCFPEKAPALLTGLESLLPWAPETPLRLLLLTSGELRNDARLLDVMQQSAQEIFSESVVFTHGESLLAILYAKEADETLQSPEVNHFLCRHQLKGGVSLPFTHLGNLRYFYLQALYASEKYKESTGTDAICRFYPYGVSYLIRHGDTTANYYALHPDVRAIFEQDSKKGTEKLRILFAFLCNRKSLVDTAKKLFIHRNTLVYQLNQIKDLLTCDLSDDYSCEYMRMSIRYLKYLKKNPSLQDSLPETRRF